MTTPDVTSSPKIIDHPIKSSTTTNPGSYILIALAVIALIGSAVATGVLYSQLGNTALAIAGGGVAFAILCIALSRYCVTEKTTVVSLAASTHPTPTKITSEEREQIKKKVEENVAALEKKYARPTPEKNELPPPPLFPHLFDLKFDDIHPLSKALPKESFAKADAVGDMFRNLTAGLRTSSEPPKKILSFDNEILDAKLDHLFKASDYLDTLVRLDPGRSACIALVKARLEEFDKAIQLKERFQRLYPDLRVRDLLPAWSESPLRYALAMDDELLLLKVSSMAPYDGAQVWDTLRRRIAKLSDKALPFTPPSSFTKESVGEILLTDLPKLTAQHIHTSPQIFPPYTFLLIETSELQKVETHLLLTEQLEFIFSTTYYVGFDTKYYVHNLLPEQINNCVHLVLDKELFKNLNDEQVVKFDRSKMDQLIFKGVFLALEPRTIQRIGALKENVSDYFKFFPSTFFEYLDIEQIRKIDYSKIDQPTFDKIFTGHSVRTSLVFKKITDAEILSMKHLLKNRPDLKDKMLPGHIKLIFEGS